MLLLAFVFILIALPAFADENCPVKLQESQTQSLIIAQSRDNVEQRLAQAIRANQELGALYDKTDKELKKVKDELAALKPKPESDKK